jgi:serine/threonine protein phosphatase PrpC
MSTISRRGARCADVVSLREGRRGAVCCIFADGASGSEDPVSAARSFVRTVENMLDIENAVQGSVDLRGLASAADVTVMETAPCSETGGLIVIVGTGMIFGAGVGDTHAILVPDDAEAPHRRLTGHFSSRPRFGEGFAVPSAFSLRDPPNGLLLIVSDGVTNAMTDTELAGLVRGTTTGQACNAVIDGIGLPTDDSTIVAIRI